MISLQCLILERSIEHEWQAVVHNHHKYTCSKYVTVDSTRRLFPFIKQHFEIINNFAPQATWLMGAVATKFDALQFTKFYASLVYGILLEDWSGLIVHQSLWIRNCTLLKSKSSFSLSKIPMLNPGLDSLRLDKITKFRDAIRCVFKKLKALQDSKISKGETIERYWQTTFKVAPTFNQLPKEDLEAFEAIFNLVGHVVMSVFDNPVFLGRAKSLLRKIPITFITTSLYFINPAPFINQALKLFLWSPIEGTASLCQRIAGALCGFIETRNRYHQKCLELKNQDWFNDLQIALGNNILSSLDSDLNYEIMLQNCDIQCNDVILKFCRLHFRFHEKNQFVQNFTNEGDNVFIEFLGQVLPPLMNELQKAGSLSTLISTFFKLISTILEVVEQKPDYAILAIKNHIFEFMKYFYTFLHFAEQRRDTDGGTPTFLLIVDTLFTKVLRLDDFDAFHVEVGDLRYYNEILNVVTRNSDKRRKASDILAKLESNQIVNIDGIIDQNCDLLDTLVPILLGAFC